MKTATLVNNNEASLIIPSAIRREAGFKNGQWVEVHVAAGMITITAKLPGAEDKKRRSVAPAPARKKFGRAVDALRREATRTPAAKLTMRQINAEIAAARKERRSNQKPTR